MVVATRDIRPSEVHRVAAVTGKDVDVSDDYLQVVLHDDAAVVGPNYETEAVCLECLGRVDGSVLCNLCNLPLCSEACQGGPNHLPECLVSNPICNRNVPTFSLLRCSDSWSLRCV